MSPSKSRSAQQAPTSQNSPVRATYGKGEMTRLCDAAIQQLNQRVDEIANRAESGRNFENTVLALEAALTDFSDQTAPLSFMKDVSMDKGLRDEGAACEEKTSQVSVDVFTDKKLYQAVLSTKPPIYFSSKLVKRGQGVRHRTHDSQRLHSEYVLWFEHNGLKLSDAKLAEYKDLKKQLVTLQTEFEKNLNEDVSSVVFTADELEGLPADYVNRCKKTADGKIIVTTKEPDMARVLNNAVRSETRRKFQYAYYNRQTGKNTPLLEKAIVLREKLAKLMGYKTWADEVTSVDHMAKNGDEVLKFLNGLRSKLKIRVQQDLAHMLAYKKKGEPKATALHSWDLRYLDYQIKKNEYAVDEEEVRNYFPAEVVIQGMFKVYSTLLGVSYVEVPHAQVWSPDVKLYAIHDKGSDEAIAYFYTDFNPRDGKYGHAAIVANLNAPTADKPSLLSHDDVETIFHEFGHIMHMTLTRAPYGSLSGSSVAQDFVEAPSQMLENWVWQPQILQMLSGHYLDHSKKLPKDLLHRLIQLRDVNRGYFYTRQLWLGLSDMKFHTAQGPVDTTKVMNGLHGELIGVPIVEGAHFQASFGHLMNGYDAGYYGYLWSEVYAQDMFTRFENGNLLNPEVGADYRRWILEGGNMKPAMELVKGFIGRKPNNKAFFRKLGIQ